MEKIKFTLTWINDRHEGHFGKFPILTSPNGNSFIYKCGSIYSFNREFNLGEETIVATSFEHGFDLINLKNEIKELKERNKTLFSLVKRYETQIIKKLGKKLRGVRVSTKLNNFLKK